MKRNKTLPGNEALSLEAYKQRVNQAAQSLLEAIASVAAGDLNVEFKKPDGLDSLGDLAVGLEYLVEDLRQRAQSPTPLRAQPQVETVPLALGVEAEPRGGLTGRRERQEYADSREGLTSLARMEDEEHPNAEEWLPGMKEAVERGGTIRGQNGDNEKTLALPIRLQDEVIGVLGFNRDQGRDWNEKEIAAIEAIVEQVGLALENQRLFDQTQAALMETQDRTEELALINRVVSIVASSFDLRESLEVVATELNRAVPVDETGIALLNEEGTELIVVAEAVKDPNAISSIGLSIPVQGNPSTLEVMATKKPVVVVSPQTSPQTAPIQDIMQERQYETLVIFPLIAQNEVIGTVGMAMKEPGMSISPDEMRLSETIVIQASTAIQNARLFEQTQAALTETASLYQASAELNTARSFEDILNVMQGYTILGQGANFISINTFDVAWDEGATPSLMTTVVRWNAETGIETLGPSIPLNEWSRPDQLLLRDRATVLKDDARDGQFDRATRTTLREILKAGTIVFAPLVSAGRWIGEVVATFPDIIEVVDTENRRLMTLAGQAAVAIQNLRLLDETTRRANQLQTAAEIAREASGTLDLNALLNRAVNLIRDRFGFYHSSIFLIESTDAVIQASTGEAGRQMVATRHSLPIQSGSSVIGHVTFTGEPLLVNDVMLDPTHRPHSLLPHTKAELGIPLKIGHRVTGALDVQSTETNGFSDDDVTVLQILADQLAVAVDNARSFEVAQKAVEEMREIDRLKSDFLANMSHELRTPLNSIIGFSRVILKGIDGPVNDLQKQDLEAIQTSGQHLLDMINDILDLSRIEAGKMELAIEEMDLGDVVKSVMSTASGLVKEKPIRLESEIPVNLPHVLADRTRVRQVLLNMLQNSAKFTEQGSIIVRAAVDFYGNDRPMVKIEVTDTGIGISKKDQDRLFERFSQVDSSLTRKTGGTGLGLSISRRLVELQGGTMGLTSEMGQGSTFFFTLPAAEAPITQPFIREEPVVDDRPIVLAIDDDTKITAVYERYLRGHGYRVVALTNPKEALQYARRVKPLAITVDIMMPEKDGWQVIEEIKADPETKHIPIIVCSILEDRVKALEMGAADYLVKPILEDELVKAIGGLGLNGGASYQDILVVDDDPNIMLLVEKALGRQKTYRLRYAAGGLQGLAALQKRRPDAMILDLYMPDLDGFSLLDSMKKDPHLRDVPVVILTNGNEEEIATRLGEQAGDVLHKKTFQSDELVERLKRLLSKPQPSATI